MAYTQSQLDKLEAAIAAGELRVKYEDKEVLYRSLNEMLQIRDLIRKDLGIIGTGEGRLYARFDKGLSGE